MSKKSSSTTTQKPTLKTYAFKRKYPDGRIATMFGADQIAESPEHAMSIIKTIMGLTAKKGWYAEEAAPE